MLFQILLSFIEWTKKKSLKYIFLCSELEKDKKNRFGITWEGVNGKIFIFVWTMHFNHPPLNKNLNPMQINKKYPTYKDHFPC